MPQCRTFLWGQVLRSVCTSFREGPIYISNRRSTRSSSAIGAKRACVQVKGLLQAFRLQENATLSVSTAQHQASQHQAYQHRMPGAAAAKDLTQRVRIIDRGQVYDSINLGRRIDVQWPSELMRERGGRSYWKDWNPVAGVEGPVVHRWTPCHRRPC
ncbi:hypothetical protein OS493_033940 [Desmophyllum pertusum]|uniref:Uncharacterized protein n=1 Tax=Desmophyllum pertusum TaxID=174260 RepID=A0A9W9ZY01_9CNID|nr:hypothetical protein OS493_033940 [Desmophyllum pertusum]